MLFKLLIGLLFLITLTYAEINIISPNSLKDRYKETKFPYTLSNFGNIPYGQSLVGQVIQADPLDACSPLKPINNQDNPNPVFLLVYRGNCSFVTKVKYSQIIGANLVIIVDNVQENSEKIQMIDDGYGYSLRIPSIFIDKHDGDQIEEILKKTQVPGENEQVQLSIKFAVKQKTKFVNYNFWLSTQNRQSFKLVRDFGKYYADLQKANVANFTPYYAIWTCAYCGKNGYRVGYDDNQNVKDSCISKGRYCSPDPDGDKPGKGRNVVLEDLRQICIYKLYPLEWWMYMNNFDNQCIDPQSYQFCSKLVVNAIDGLDQNKIDKCFNDSFCEEGKENCNPNIESNDNYLLSKERKTFIEKGVQQWPSVDINNDKFNGNLDAMSIFKDICQNFEEQPEACLEQVPSKQSNAGGSKAGRVGLVVLIVVVTSFLLTLFVVCVYKRLVKKEMSREMSTQVNEMVNQYIAFHESRDKKTNPDDTL